MWMTCALPCTALLSVLTVSPDLCNEMSEQLLNYEDDEGHADPGHEEKGGRFSL